MNNVDPDRLHAFTRRDLEVGVTLYLHMKSLGYTFDELIKYLKETSAYSARTEVPETAENTGQRPQRPSEFVHEVHKLTRSQRRAQKHGTRRKV